MEEEYYALLGLPKTATTEEIKKAYKDKARKHHPDKGGDPEQFKKISEAYGVLVDPELRGRYDQFGKKGMEGVDMSQHFPDFFNMFMPGMRMGRHGGGQRRTQDRVITLEVTMEEAHKGVSIKYRFKRKIFVGEAKTCEICKGQGRIAERMSSSMGIIQNIRVCPSCAGIGTSVHESQFQTHSEIVDAVVPPHCHVGYQIVIAGKADEMPQHQTGDLILRVAIKKHPIFELVANRDLLWRIRLHPLEALTSFSRVVALPSGEIISIGHKEGEPFFSEIRNRRVLPRKGLYDVQRERGSLLIEFDLQDFYFPAAKKKALFEFADVPLPVTEKSEYSLLYMEKIDPNKTSSSSSSQHQQQQHQHQHQMPFPPSPFSMDGDAHECRQS